MEVGSGEGHYAVDLVVAGGILGGEHEGEEVSLALNKCRGGVEGGGGKRGEGSVLGRGEGSGPL